jgi:hypothetical protein
MSKVWNINRESVVSKTENPEFILKQYASKVAEDTDGLFLGIVTQTVNEEIGSITYALYIVAPKLKDYMYRIIEVNVQNLVELYPLELRLFAKDPKNHRHYTCDNSKEFEAKLYEVITSPVTSAILAHLNTLIEIQSA